MNDKSTEPNSDCVFFKRLAMPDQQYDSFRSRDVAQPLSPSVMQKQTAISAPATQTMNMRNPLSAFTYLPFLRLMPYGPTSPLSNYLVDSLNNAPRNQPIESNSSDRTTVPSTATTTLEEPIRVQLNIPIEMMLRTIPAQLALPQEQHQRRCTCPTHLSSTAQIACPMPSDNGSKPATSLIRKAQEIFFGNNLNNDRGDVAVKSFNRVNMPTTDSRRINETIRSSAVQPSQERIFYRSSPSPSHPSTTVQCSNAPSFAHSKRCECD